MEDWAKERVNKLAYWTIMFLKTYEIKPKNYDLESGSHEHLVQNLLKDLMKVFDKKTFPSKDRNKPGREQVRFSGVEEHNEHNTSLKEAQVKREKDEKKMIAN